MSGTHWWNDITVYGEYVEGRSLRENDYWFKCHGTDRVALRWHIPCWKKDLVSETVVKMGETSYQMGWSMPAVSLTWVFSSSENIPSKQLFTQLFLFPRMKEGCMWCNHWVSPEPQVKSTVLRLLSQWNASIWHQQEGPISLSWKRNPPPKTDREGEKGRKERIYSGPGEQNKQVPSQFPAGKWED